MHYRWPAWQVPVTTGGPLCISGWVVCMAQCNRPSNAIVRAAPLSHGTLPQRRHSPAALSRGGATGTLPQHSPAAAPLPRGTFPRRRHSDPARPRHSPAAAPPSRGGAMPLRHSPAALYSASTLLRHSPRKVAHAGHTKI